VFQELKEVIIYFFYVDELQGWLGGTKMRAVIGFDRVVNQLRKYNAPREVMYEFSVPWITINSFLVFDIQ
jgi:hypothetical protein